MPGWDLHPLQGNISGHWSVKVSGNWRLTFVFEGNGAYLAPPPFSVTRITHPVSQAASVSPMPSNGTGTLLPTAAAWPQNPGAEKNWPMPAPRPAVRPAQALPFAPGFRRLGRANPPKANNAAVDGSGMLAASRRKLSKATDVASFEPRLLFSVKLTAVRALALPVE